MNQKIETMLLESADLAPAIAKGELEGRMTSRETTISSVRHKLNLLHSEFAKVLSVSSRTVESWEQGRRVPGSVVSVLLRIAERNPKAVLDALKSISSCNVEQSNPHPLSSRIRIQVFSLFRTVYVAPLESGIFASNQKRRRRLLDCCKRVQ